MNIAIIGTGNVGGTLAVAFQKAGHKVVFGVKDPGSAFKGKDLAVQYNLSYFKVEEAGAKADIIVLSTPAQAVIDVVKGMGNLAGKIIIDTMNTALVKLDGFTNTTDAILANCNTIDVVKCFNTTGFENMANPIYNGEGIDMFVAGSSNKAKQAAMQLARDIGFGHCYDFGGDDKFFALEQLAFAWINLAILQKQGRDIAFRVERR